MLKFTTDVLDDILDKFLLTNKPEGVMKGTLLELIEEVPPDYLLKEESITLIAEKLQKHLPENEDRKNLAEAVMSATSIQSDEVKISLNKILDAVFEK